MLWILMISKQAAYQMHSVHTTRADAEAWKQCKQHDGDDCAILEVNKDDADEIVEAFGKAQLAKTAARPLAEKGLPRP